MSDWLFKSWIKVSVVTVILFFFYHLFISLKLEQEDCKKDVQCTDSDAIELTAGKPYVAAEVREPSMRGGVFHERLQSVCVESAAGLAEEIGNGRHEIAPGNRAVGCERTTSGITVEKMNTRAEEVEAQRQHDGQQGQKSPADLMFQRLGQDNLGPQ